MNSEPLDISFEARLGMIEQMLGQFLAEQAANANGGGGSDINTPVMPIIGGSGESRSAWIFDPGANAGEPHWKNPAVQCGWIVDNVSKGINDSADGTYYVDIDITSSAPDMTLRHGSSVPSNTDDHIYLYIGKVENGEQTEGIYSMPYVFMYR